MSRKQNSLLLFLIFFVLFTISSKSDYRFQGTILTDYTNVTVTEAYNIVENTTTIFILDVRTQEEYSTGHLVNAKLIPYTEIISR
ncbi:MAG: rhodanese-like domain-containing protein, partial [Candidatus Hodarchaeales archaeon]